MKKFRTYSRSLHGNMKAAEFDTLEQAIEAAEKAQKRRKGCIGVYEFVKVRENGSLEFKNVYTTNNGLVYSCPFIFWS